MRKRTAPLQQWEMGATELTCARTCKQVRASTQSTDHVQYGGAQVLALPHNRVNVTSRRAGGR